MISLQDEIADGLEAENVMRAAQRRLDTSAYAALKSVICRFRHGTLRLSGHVPMYFHKQLAQEAVRDLSGVTEIVNNISVSVEAPNHRVTARRAK